MDAKKKAGLLEDRMNKLSVSNKENHGVRRKIEREIRRLKKKSDMT